MPDLVCLQETKLQNVSNQTVRNVLGFEFENNFLFQPADGTRGGLLLAARDSIYNLQHLQVSKHHHYPSPGPSQLYMGLKVTLARKCLLESSKH
jgi:exonuclease III